MPSHVQLQNNQALERKKRQEKFRKRTGSLFNKTKLLARDTDAWVALVVRDRSGQVRSFRSSDDPNWPPSIRDLIKRYPTGPHKYLEKHAISGFWKTCTKDDDDPALSQSEAESLSRGIQEMEMSSLTAGTDPGSPPSIVETCRNDGGIDEEIDTEMDEAPVTVVDTPKMAALRNIAVLASIELDSLGLDKDSQCQDSAGSEDSTNATAADNPRQSPVVEEVNMKELGEEEGRSGAETGESEITEAVGPLGHLEHCDSWEIVVDPKTDGQKEMAHSPKVASRINPKELLEGWDWVFQK